MIPMAKNRHKKNKELDDRALESASGGQESPFAVRIDEDGLTLGGHKIGGGLKQMNEPLKPSIDIPGLG